MICSPPIPWRDIAADRNVGLCRLWLGDHARAGAALRRWIDGAGPTTEAVDLAVVCQLIDESTDKEPIEQVRLSWPLRDRPALLKTLEAQPTIVRGESRHLDPEDDESPEVECFHWLDRPGVEPRSGLTRQEIPLVQADILIGPETVMLEIDDDGRLNGLIDQFTAMVGRAVPPAHPRTKVIGQVDRSEHALSWHWYLPPELPEQERKRLDEEQTAYLMSEVWPGTPMTIFGGRSPLQVARSGKDATLLRGAGARAGAIGRRVGRPDGLGRVPGAARASRPSPRSIPRRWRSTRCPSAGWRWSPWTGSTTIASWRCTSGLTSGGCSS